MALTIEDKQWIQELLDRQLSYRLDRQAEQFSERLDRQAEQFSERLDRQAESFAERLEKVETTLLTEFHKWASPAEAKNRAIMAAVQALDIQMEALSDRVKKLEGGK